MPLFVLTGPPGAGKSTLAELLAASLERSVLVPGDRFLGFVRQGYVNPWLDGSEAQNEAAWEASFRAAGAYLEAGYDVVYDGIVYPDALARVRELAACDGLSYVLLLPSVATCLRRIRARRGHGFDDLDVAREMHERFGRSAIDERFVVREDDQGLDAVADIVLGRYVV